MLDKHFRDKFSGLRTVVVGLGVGFVIPWAAYASEPPSDLIEFVQDVDKENIKKNARNLITELREAKKEKERESTEVSKRELEEQKEKLKRHAEAYKEIQNRSAIVKDNLRTTIGKVTTPIFLPEAIFDNQGLKDRTEEVSKLDIVVGYDLKIDNKDSGLKLVPYFVKNGKNYFIEYRVAIGDAKNVNLSKFNKLDEDEKKELKSELEKLSSDLRLSFSEAEINDKTKFVQAFNRQINKKEFIQNSSDSVRSGLKEKVEDIGTTSDKYTDLWKVEQDLKDLASAKQRHIKGLSNKQKIVDWMAENSVKDLEDCQIIIRALKITDAQKAKQELDEKTLEECEKELPKKAEVAENSDGFFKKLLSQTESEEKSDDFKQKKAEEEKLAKENFERAQRSMVEMQQLQAYCESFKIGENAKQASEQLTRPIEKIQNAIVQSGGTSLTFAKLCSPLVDQDFSEIDLEMGMLEDYSFRASTIAQEFSRSEDGNKQLLGERDALSQTVRKSFVALEKAGAMLNNAQLLQGMIDPMKIHPQHAADAQDKVNTNLSIAQERMSKLAMYHNCALAGLNAIQAEIRTREDELNTQLGGKGLSARGGPGRNTPVVGGPNSARSAGQRNSQGRSNRRPPASSANKSKYLNN